MATQAHPRGRPVRGDAPAQALAPVTVRGKFLFSGMRKLAVRGVTYGPFAPDARTGEGFRPDTVRRDFAQMAERAVNAVRLYDVPPGWLLDAAAEHGLRVMIGLPWEQHVAFLDDRDRGRAIERRVRAGARACAGHPAVLCYAVGNEIPASIVRWHGRRRVERHIERLHAAVKDEQPEALVTYVSYPSTEYLRLGFLDLVCFNVYLEDRARFAAYLARLQSIADDRPLVLAELGLDSRRNGEDAQARALAWQLRETFEGGCAGAFAFAWTDEWHRGGADIDDWDFGLTARDRRPKPALAAVASAYRDAPFAPREWPSASVVVCSYNGAATIGETLAGVQRLDYPRFEVIVVSDGATDATAAIAAASGARVIVTENRGLSSARNTGLAAAHGEIVAYLDDDASPDEHWLKHLAHAFMTGGHAAVGGPNVPVPEDGRIAGCVAQAPGGPTHVLLSDTEAEHVPGCNMAFRRERLQALGGFDARFRVAGDDVDVCWRVRQRGWTIGFSPAAVVWHHRRGSLRAYLRQQRGYGEAEALLERKWPEKYSAAGQLAWAGRLYGGAAAERAGRRSRVYYGTWGAGLFQSLYRPRPGLLASLVRIPEWYLAMAALAVVAALGVLWPPLLLAAGLPAVAAGAALVDAARGATRAAFPAAPGAGATAVLRVVTGALYVLQPLARLRGRMRRGLTPWRTDGSRGVSLPRPRTAVFWDERWQSAEERLRGVEAALTDAGAVTRRGGDFDRWDLEVRGGLFGAARLRMAIEEHGGGRQLVRFRSWPRWKRKGIAVFALALGLFVGVVADRGSRTAAIVLGLSGLLLALRMLYEIGISAATLAKVMKHEHRHDSGRRREPDELVAVLERRLTLRKPGVGVVESQAGD
jgi:GT2 family glycosyltransferase